jgi:hypothetical protein
MVTSVRPPISDMAVNEKECLADMATLDQMVDLPPTTLGIVDTNDDAKALGHEV